MPKHPAGGSSPAAYKGPQPPIACRWLLVWLWSLPQHHPAGADVPQGLPQPCLVRPDLGRGLHFGCLWHCQTAGLGGKGQTCPRHHKYKAAPGTAGWRGSHRAPDAAGSWHRILPEQQRSALWDGKQPPMGHGQPAMVHRGRTGCSGARRAQGMP